MNKSSSLFVSVCALLTFGQVGVAHAGRMTISQDRFFGMPVFGIQGGMMGLDQGDPPQPLQIATGLVPLGQVFATINAQEPGTQLDTKTVTEDGRTLYVVRWQASLGRIVIFWVNAETGQIIRRQD
ncbi:MAG: hypothetical protein RL186_1100 [Pseudomonadota bacterium]|jgi:hypothetical protein